MPYDCPKIVCESGARFTKYLTTVLRLSSIMPQLPSIYDGHLIYKTSYEERKAFLRYNSLAYRTIVVGLGQNEYNRPDWSTAVT